MRFMLVDRISELTSGEFIAAEKNLSLAEEYLADHFPGFPVMPGVLMIEALVQTGAWLVREKTDFQPSLVTLKEMKAVRFNNFVTPGKTLKITMTKKKQDGNCWDFMGTGTVDGGSAVNARMILEARTLAELNPSLAALDDRRRQDDRAMFAQIWKSAN